MRRNRSVPLLLHHQNTLTLSLTQRRTHAIEAARSSFLDLDFMEDLSLSGASSEDDTSISRSLPPVAPTSSTSNGGGPASPVISKTKRKAFKPRFKAWAKNLLSHPETLDLRHGLPEGLESEWRAVVCPKGKRCLVATSTDGSELLFPFRIPSRILTARIHSYRKHDLVQPCSRVRPRFPLH
jgi:hypothetical protein